MSNRFLVVDSCRFMPMPDVDGRENYGKDKTTINASFRCGIHQAGAFHSVPCRWISKVIVSKSLGLLDIRRFGRVFIFMSFLGTAITEEYLWLWQMEKKVRLHNRGKYIFVSDCWSLLLRVDRPEMGPRVQ